MNRLVPLVAIAVPILCVLCAPARAGLTTGPWKSADKSVEFNVSADGKQVENFAVYITVSGCGDYKITHLNVVPIVDGSFSFTGNFYASGTFGSDTSASGEYGFDRYELPDCDELTDGPVLWNAACDGCSPAPTYTPASSTPTPTPPPPLPAQIVLNGSSFGAGSQFTATFQLNVAVAQAFNAYAVVNLPDGSMLDAIKLSPQIGPVAANVPGLPAGFTYPLMSLAIPPGAPKGNGSVMVGFFEPGKPITGPGDAFLLATAPFELE